jgi:hypothetical protein
MHELFTEIDQMLPEERLSEAAHLICTAILRHEQKQKTERERTGLPAEAKRSSDTLKDKKQLQHGRLKHG